VETREGRVFGSRLYSGKSYEDYKKMLVKDELIDLSLAQAILDEHGGKRKSLWRYSHYG
jgi:hypothetical protein